MELRAGDVGLWRLVAQHVVTPLPGAEDVVRELAAVQAQDLRSAATSVALRTSAGTVDSLAAALEAGTVVRSWPMRGTLHLLEAADLGWVLDLTAARTLSSIRGRYAQLGLDGAATDRAREIAVEVLAGGRGSTRRDLMAAFEARGLSTTGQRGPHLLGHLAHTQVVCLGPLEGREQRIVLTAEWITAPRRVPVEEAAAVWAARYLRAHGPAGVGDFAGWAKLPVTVARAAFAAVRADFEVVEVDGVEHLVRPGLGDEVAAHRRAARGAHVLPGFDEFVLGYADRSHVMTAEEFERVVPGGNGVFRGTVVTGGRVTGTWTRDGAAVVVAPFAPATPATDAAVARRAAALPSGWFA